MDTQSNKPVAVVTGVGPGLGASLARRFAQAYAVALLRERLVRDLAEVVDQRLRLLGKAADFGVEQTRVTPGPQRRKRHLSYQSPSRSASTVHRLQTSSRDGRHSGRGEYRRERQPCIGVGQTSAEAARTGMAECFASSFDERAI